MPRRMRQPALLLDSGGVLMLIDGDVVAVQAARAGVRVNSSTARRAVSLAARDQDLDPGARARPFAHAWAAHVGCAPEAADRMWDTIRREVDDTVLWGVVNPDALRLFDALPRGVQRYVVSNANGRAHAELAAAGLLSRLDGVLDSAVVGIAKPDQRIFRMAAVALDRPLDECRYVGDTLDGAPADIPSTILYDPFDIYPEQPGRYTRILALGQLIDLI
ncbi:HAD family hydrolase [Saccharopolyspora sp. 5N708]|uniref:HAD family hydrolase n=1 Tax=Saccharopolyspora sp. 5N708 TaxID=3457424 RepID=UPI003FD02F03